MIAPRERWQIPPNLWAWLAASLVGVVLTFGANVLYTNTVAREQTGTERALCELLRVLGAGPTPPAGPAGDRARTVIPLMKDLERSACREG